LIFQRRAFPPAAGFYSNAKYTYRGATLQSPAGEDTPEGVIRYSIRQLYDFGHNGYSPPFDITLAGDIKTAGSYPSRPEKAYSRFPGVYYLLLSLLN
jgi:hypothetical protein